MGLAFASPDGRKKRIRLPGPTDSPVVAIDLAMAPNAESHGQESLILVPTLLGSGI